MVVMTSFVLPFSAVPCEASNRPNTTTLLSAVSVLKVGGVRVWMKLHAALR